MEILGIGPSELIFIVILALIILGPRDMQKAGRTIGRWLRDVVTSDGWKFFQQTSREIQTLPNKLMREAALEEFKQVQQELGQPLDPGTAGAKSGLLTGADEPLSTDPARRDQPTILPPPNPSPPEAKDDDPNA